jgi:FKBP-type peptidyl-prolyl cis-trans isomerase FkpA
MAPTTEVSALRGALDAQGISAVQDDRGFFYIIGRKGDTALRPSVCSNIKVTYTLRSISGQQLEAANNVNLYLSTLITGWQEGVPLIGKGGAITLYLPPSLAYGANGSGSIPPNSNLIFQIDLVDVL